MQRERILGWISHRRDFIFKIIIRSKLRTFTVRKEGAKPSAVATGTFEYTVIQRDNTLTLFHKGTVPVSSWFIWYLRKVVAGRNMIVVTHSGESLWTEVACRCCKRCVKLYIKAWRCTEAKEKSSVVWAGMSWESDLYLTLDACFNVKNAIRSKCLDSQLSHYRLEI